MSAIVWMTEGVMEKRSDDERSDVLYARARVIRDALTDTWSCFLVLLEMAVGERESVAR